MSYFGALWIDIVYFTLITLFSILTYFYYKYTYWQKKHVPYIPASFPFGNIGKLILNRESFGETFRKLYKQFREKGAKYGGFYMIHKPSIIITDPELIKTIFNKDFNSFHDRLGFANEKVDPLSVNLFGTKGEQWKNLRKKSSPTFTSGKMKAMFNNIMEATDDLAYVLEKPAQTSEPVIIREIVAKLFIDVIGTSVFGIKCNSLKNENNDFYRYGRKFMNSFLNNNAIFVTGMVFSKLFNFLQIRQTSKDVSNFYMNVLKDTIETREAQNIERNDFIDLFIKMKNRENINDENINENLNNTTPDTVSFNELAAQAFVFMVAGFEASSQTTTFCLYELALNKEIQDKLRKEIIDTVKKCGGQIKYEALMEMEYMDKVLKETLRKYPTAPSINRECTVPYKMPDSDVVIDKGTPVWISVLGLHNDPEYFPNPDKFDPERFNSEENKKRHPYTYIPFGEGQRICIGMRFALLQLKLALAIILKNYIFTIDPKTQVPLKLGSQGFLLFSEKEVYLRVSKNVY